MVQAYWKNHLFWSLIILPLLFQGCGTYNFANVMPNIQVVTQKSKAVSVATSDQRHYVLTGTCPPTYVGIRRGGYGNPFRVYTESGLPLADDLTKAVSESLSNRGYKSSPVFVKYTDDYTKILGLLKERKAESSLLFVIKKWDSDTFVNIGLDYEIELTVFNEGMTKLASTSVSEKGDRPGSILFDESVAEREVTNAFKKALETLLNDPKILLAIQ
jgi:hypothetical protein